MAAHQGLISDGPWAASLPLDASAAVAPLRLRGDVRVGVDGAMLWLRGTRADETLQRAIEHVAPLAMFSVTADDVLIRPGDQLPSGRLPDIAWMAIDQFVRVAPPPTRVAGVVDERVLLQLVRSDEPKTANGLLTTLPTLAAWVDDAPTFRFAPLRYAAAGDRVLILGEPIPSVPGTPLHDSDGVCVPCGWSLAPPIDSASLRSRLAIDVGDIALFEATGWHRVRADAFTLVSRDSVRRTLAKGGDR